MKTKSQRIAAIVINGINSGSLPVTSLKMTANQIMSAWAVSRSVAQEIAWIMNEQVKVIG